jgi:hypothetical protein
VNVIWVFAAASRKPMSRSASGADIDDGDLGVGAGERIEDFHLVRGRGDVDHVGDVGMKALQRPLRRLGVEGAGRDVVGDEIVEQHSCDSGLADAALVRSHQNDCRFCHKSLRAPRISAIAG